MRHKAVNQGAVGPIDLQVIDITIEIALRVANSGKLFGKAANGFYHKRQLDFFWPLQQFLFI
ncbi:hypothetical protein D3C75_1344490 [compost metagenome]